MLGVLTNQRAVTDEIMDRPDVDPAAHLQALRGLERINRVSRTAQRMLEPVVQLARRAALQNITLLDVACGGGDVPVGVAVAAQRFGIRVDLILLDRSPTALKQAADSAARGGISCRTIQADLLADEPPAIRADVVTNSLFLHHLPRPQEVVRLIRMMSRMAGRLVVISDLRRSRPGFLAAWAGCRALSRSRIVHHDGPVSVRAAWTMGELANFAAQAGITGARVQRCRPWRMLLTWEPPS